MENMRLLALCCCTFFHCGIVDALEVGVSKVDITPYDFEIPKKNKEYKKGDPFWDTGVDQQFDFEEPNAFGEDGQPGIAGVDDNNDGLVDNCDRFNCDEYLAVHSDDVKDPNGDNFHKKNNPKGTENDKKFQFLHLGGFGPYYPLFLPNRLATGVHDPIWARTLALRDSEGQTLVLTSTDLPGLTWKHINPVKRRIERELGISRANVVITSTHAHSGPDAAGYWSTLRRGHNRPYTNRLRSWLFESVRSALASMKSGKMKTVTTTHYSCFDPMNRILKKDPDCRLPNTRGDRKNRSFLGEYDMEIVQNDKRDPIIRNTEITAVQFLDHFSNETIATFINWHTHPDAFGPRNLKVSSDYSHFLRKYVEEELGGTAVYFTGTLGNQISGTIAPLWNENRERVFEEDILSTNGDLVPKFSRNNLDEIRSIGYEVGYAVTNALRASIDIREDPRIWVKTEKIDNPVDNFVHNFFTGSVWKSNVAREDRMRRYFSRCLWWRGCVRSDISVAQIGDLGIATVPGEMDPSYYYGRQQIVGRYQGFGNLVFPRKEGIKDHMPGKHQAILGQANNYLSYLIHKSDNIGWWNFSHPIHYEEMVTIGKNFGDDVGNKLMHMLGSKVRYSKRKIYPKPRKKHFRPLKPTYRAESMVKTQDRPPAVNGLIIGVLSLFDKSKKKER